MPGFSKFVRGFGITSRTFHQRQNSALRMIDLYNTLLKKRIGSFRAAMQAAQTLNVVRLEASQM
jgi:hypothetical protein